MSDSVPSAWRGVPLSLDEMHNVIHGMQAYYDERATQYDDWYNHINLYDDPANNAAWHAEMEQLTAWVQAFGQGRLLEIASGTGWWTRRLARRSAVTTLDYSPAMIEVLRGRLRAEGQRADVSRGDAYRLPYASGVFDSCFFGFWLSHVPAPLLDTFFGEVCRVVRHGGSLLLVDSKPFRGEVPGVELKQERVLNDGSHHQIVKVYHTPDSLCTLLARYSPHVETRTTGKFFTVGSFTVA